MSGRFLLMVALLALSSQLLLAHEGEQKVLAPFLMMQFKPDDFKIRAKADGRAFNFLIKGHAHYPNGTKLSIMVRYIVGETSELYPFGKPGRKEQYVFKKVAFVTDRAWSIKIPVRDRRLPPGEYAVASWFLFKNQSRKVQKDFAKNYVPAEERPTNLRNLGENLDATSVRVYAVAKTALAIPSFKLRAKFQSLEGKLWQKQKAQYRADVLHGFRDWMQQIADARNSLHLMREKILNMGQLQSMDVDRIVAAEENKLGKKEAEALAVMRMGRRGLARFKEMGAGASGGFTDPYRYFRLVGYGEGMAGNEDPRAPNPPPVWVKTAEDGRRELKYVPWKHNYVKPRLDLVLEEMRQYRQTRRIMPERDTFYEVKSSAEKVIELLKAVSMQIDAVKDLTTPGGVLEQYEAAGKHDDGQIKSLYQKYDIRLKSPIVLANNLDFEYVQMLQKLLSVTRSPVKFPVCTWPIPASMAHPPKLSKEEREAAIKKQFGSLMDEVPKDGKKDHGHDD